jgi:O-antigen ligase
MPYSSTPALPKSQPLSAWTSLTCTLVLVGGLLLNFLVAERHDGQRCIELLALLFCVGTISASGRGNALAAARTPVQLFLLVFFTLGLVSAALAWSPRHAMYEWSSMLLLVMLAFAVATEISKTGADGIGRILQLVGAVCLVYSLRIVLVYAATLASGYQIDMHDLAIGFSNARFLNHAQTALLPLLVLLCLQAPTGGLLRRIWFVLAAFWWALLFVSEARASVLALGAGCAAAFLSCRGQARGFLKFMGLTALAGVAIYLTIFIFLPMLAGLKPIGSVANVVARTAADPASGRQVLWKRAIELIAQHPWLGAGPLHFSHYGADLQLGAHPHDWIMQIGAEWGVPAFLCAVALIGLAARALWRAGACIAPADLGNQQILAAFVVAAAAIPVDALFSGVLVMPQSRLAIALVTGCVVGWVRSLEDQARPAPALLRHGVAVLALAGAAVLTWSLAPSLPAKVRGEPLGPAEQAVNMQVHWPRMWEAGYF